METASLGAGFADGAERSKIGGITTLRKRNTVS
jgi:hypothetical protein